MFCMNSCAVKYPRRWTPIYAFGIIVRTVDREFIYCINTRTAPRRRVCANSPAGITVFFLSDKDNMHALGAVHAEGDL
jgi:hypothetical protein